MVLLAISLQKFPVHPQSVADAKSITLLIVLLIEEHSPDDRMTLGSFNPAVVFRRFNMSDSEEAVVNCEF